MDQLVCANCLETIELKKFFDSISDISSDLSKLTFNCPNCGKIELYNLFKTGIANTAFNNSSSNINEIPNFDGKRTGNIVTLTSHDDNGNKIFSRTIPIRLNSENQVTGELPFPSGNSDIGQQRTADQDNNPYSPPSSHTSNSAPISKNKKKKAPDDVIKKIRSGFYLGIASGFITTVFALVSKEPFMFIDVAFIFALSIGIFFKSRVCATLMVIYFIVSKIIMIIETEGQALTGIPVALVFLYGFCSAMIATYQYHRR